MPSLLQQDLQHVLDHTRELWEELRGKRIFVTGGTGFFGCWLLETFVFANEQLGLGAQLVSLTRNPEAFQRKAPHLAAHPSINLWKGDVRDFDFPRGGFSHVIHAATTSGAAVPPAEMLDTIIAGTRRALDFAADCGAKKFLLTSSGAVYGKQPPDLAQIPETYSGAPNPTDPNSAYGEGKRVAELLCAIYHREHGIESKIARCFAFLGPHLPLDAHFAAGNFIRDALAGDPIRIGGDGTPLRSYLYAADLAIWLWTILFRGVACRPYNVGSGHAVSIIELAQAVANCMSPGVDISLGAKAIPGIPPARYICDNQRAQELLLKEWILLPEQIEKTLLWHRKQSLAY